MTKTALVTGAVEGMGRLMARKLAQQGWVVFAGVLPGADTTALTQGVTLHAIDQDVSDDHSVRQSEQQIASILNGQGLNLVINNAGIANMGQGVVEGLDIEAAKRMFEINTWGQVRIAQAFLPHMRKAAPDAKMINFGSGAVVVNPPGAGAYNMSKHAVTGMTGTLRHELAAFGMQATTIFPGGVKTAMTANSHETTKQVFENVPQNVREVYEPVLGDTIMKVLPDMLEKSGNDPEYLTDEVLKIAMKKKLKPTYLVGKDVNAMKPLRLLTEGMIEKLIRGQFKIPSKAQ